MLLSKTIILRTAEIMVPTMDSDKAAKEISKIRLLNTKNLNICLFTIQWDGSTDLTISSIVLREGEE